MSQATERPTGGGCRRSRPAGRPGAVDPRGGPCGPPVPSVRRPPRSWGPEVVRLAFLGVMTAGVAGAAAAQEREEDNELDRFMEQVLARRDENRIARRQYVFDEVERFTVTGYDGEVYSRYTREYVWYRRDGVFVRSPVRFDGVDAGEDDWRRYEAEWMEAEAERARDAASETPCAPNDSLGSPAAADGVAAPAGATRWRGRWREWAAG